MELTENSIEKEKKITVDFIYTEESEARRVKDTVSRKNFFLKHGYGVSLPQNVNFDNYFNFTEEEMLKKIKIEMDTERANEVQKVIIENWEEHQDLLKQFFLTLSSKIPKSYKVIFTQYGTGGSYNPPNKIIININENSTPQPFQTFVHEAIHCLIEDSIVKKYKLTQAEKESIVDYLMINTSAIQTTCPREKYQKFGPPSEELLRKVGVK